MEDFSFSLNEAKPKHFGLEMFAVVVLVSWSLPCLQPFSFPVGLLPTGLCFPRSIPMTGRAEAVTHQGTWIYPDCLSFSCWNFSAWKRSPSVFWEASDESCAPGDSEQRLLYLLAEVCVCCIPDAGRDVAVFAWHGAFPLPPTAVQQWALSLCYTTLKSWAHWNIPSLVLHRASSYFK